MPSRIIVLTALIASCVSSLITLAVALLVLAPAIRAAPEPQAVQPVVRAERFELVDAAGTVRGSLNMEANGAGLTLRDETGTSRVVLVTDPRVGHGLFVTGEATHGAVAVGASTSNTIGMQVTSPDGARLFVQASPTGNGFALLDPAGQMIWQAP
ncbi:MAG TPA: hypothetical protein VII06_27760 [Chloroflexota bacterium]|jgi:hypothetical protein